MRPSDSDFYQKNTTLKIEGIHFTEVQRTIKDESGIEVQVTELAFTIKENIFLAFLSSLASQSKGGFVEGRICPLRKVSAAGTTHYMFAGLPINKAK